MPVGREGTTLMPVCTVSPEGVPDSDCCCGSGTTLVAARDAGRNWWGCDVVAEYVAEARRRLSIIAVAYVSATPMPSRP